MPKRQPRIHVVGRGRWAQNIVRTLETLPCELTDVQSAAEGFVVASDPAENLSWVEYADWCGVPILIEKPAALCLADVLEMQKVKVPVLVDYVDLFNDNYRQYRAERREKQPITHLFSVGPDANRSFSAFLDYAPHAFAMAFDLMPGLQFRDTLTQWSDVGPREETTLRDGKVSAIVHAGVWPKPRFTVDAYDRRQPTKEPPLTNALQHFLEVIGGAPLAIPFDLTVKIHRIFDEIESRGASS